MKGSVFLNKAIAITVLPDITNYLIQFLGIIFLVLIGFLIFKVVKSSSNKK